MAQRNGNLPVKEMNFDLWCQEQAGLPVERCDKRSDPDEAAFEAYRAKIEQYEIPYLQQKQNDIQLDRNILNKDPVDNPISSDSQTQSLQQQRQQTIEGLRHARGFLRTELARRLRLRVTPELVFELDRGAEHSQRISELLEGLHGRDESS